MSFSLITPRNNTPLKRSGTTGMACVLEGRDFIGIEREADYMEIAEKRIGHAQEGVPNE